MTSITAGQNNALFFSQFHDSEPHEYIFFATKLPWYAAYFRKIDKLVASACCEEKGSVGSQHIRLPLPYVRVTIYGFPSSQRSSDWGKMCMHCLRFRGHHPAASAQTQWEEGATSCFSFIDEKIKETLQRFSHPRTNGYSMAMPVLDYRKPNFRVQIWMLYYIMPPGSLSQVKNKTTTYLFLENNASPKIWVRRAKLLYKDWFYCSVLVIQSFLSKSMLFNVLKDGLAS